MSRTLLLLCLMVPLTGCTCGKESGDKSSNSAAKAPEREVPGQVPRLGPPDRVAPPTADGERRRDAPRPRMDLGDSVVSPEREARRAERIAEFDTDGDGQLSEAEREA